MRRFGWKSLVLAGLMAAGLGASPAPPSYQRVASVIERVRADWARPGVAADPNAPGWNVLFDTLLKDLQAYSTATTEHDRLVALNQVYQLSVALYGVGWAPAEEIREELREWLRPRVRIAWAGRRLVDTLQGLPAAATADVQGNRDRWRSFVDSDLGKALRAYDASATVADRRKGLDGVHRALDALQARNQSFPWNPSLELQSAVNDLFSLPNFDVSADLSTVSPLFNVNLVTDGWVYRKGYWSWVTAGQKTGFGLMPSDDGIAFYNKQMLTSTTNIHDFQNQIASDQRGRRAAKMYQFGATSTDNQELTVVTMIRNTGLELYPSFGHAIGLDVGSTPQGGGGLQRAIAGLVGFGQPRITQMVQQNALTQLQPRMVQEAAEMGWEKTSAEAAQRNVTLRQYLVGNNRLVFRDFLVEGLSLRSRPENILASGLLTYSGAPRQMGADAPQPSTLAAPDSGVSADLHLGSLLSNVSEGYLKRPEVQSVQNLMVQTSEVPPGAPPSQGAKVTRNVDYPTFLKSVDAAAAANNQKNLTLRVKRPTQPPEFAADAQGNLVALVHDFQIEVPAPKNAAGGAAPPAKVYRMTSPLAEFAIAFKIEPGTGTEPMRLVGRVAGFDPGPGGKIFAVQDDEAKAQPLTAFTTALVFGVVRARLQNQPINMPLNNLQLNGFAVRSVSPLDPSGWIRVVLDRTASVPTASATP